jgi:hypothetical protein
MLENSACRSARRKGTRRICDVVLENCCGIPLRIASLSVFIEHPEADSILGCGSGTSKLEYIKTML